MSKRALEADPLSISASNVAADAYYFSRRFDEALNQHQKTIEIEPNRRAADVAIGLCYQQKGLFDDAIAAYQKAISSGSKGSNVQALLAYAYAASGRRSEAMKIRESTKDKGPGEARLTF